MEALLASRAAVAAMLAAAADSAGTGAADGRRARSAGPPEDPLARFARLIAAGDDTAFAVRPEARTAADGVFVCEAIVSIAAPELGAQPVRLLGWQRGERRPPPAD